MVRVWFDLANDSLPPPHPVSPLSTMSSFQGLPSLRRVWWWEEPVNVQTMCEPRLGRGPENLCLLLSFRTHSRNKCGGAIYSQEALATENSDVFKVHQRSFCGSSTFSDQRDDSGDLKIWSDDPGSPPPLQILASAPPEMIPLSGGFPNPQMFPFKQLTLEVSGGDPIVLQGKGLQVIYISHPIAKTHSGHCPTPRQPCNTCPPRGTLVCCSNFANCRKRLIHLIRWLEMLQMFQKWLWYLASVGCQTQT